jgi:peroxiredoxin
MGRLFGAIAVGVTVIGLTMATGGAQGQAPAKKGIQPNEHPVLAVGSSIPDFNLPGVDGKMHKPGEWASAKVLAIVFECNHCTTSQLYEGRLEKIVADYKSKGMAIVSINPNNPKSVRYDEMGYTDMNDSLAEMKTRMQFRGFQWPYLYDGETQEVANKFGVVATPHIYLFDKDRKLQYEGRIDDNQREDLVKVQDARNALDAMFAGKPVAVTDTKAFGCTTKWLAKSGDIDQEMNRFKAAPVTIEAATADQVKTLRANATDKPTLLYVYPSKCATCAADFPDVMKTYWMYHKERGFDLTTIAEGPAADESAVLEMLKGQLAWNPNKLYTGDHASLQTALGVTWKAGTPLTLVIAPGGKIVYQKDGKADILQARRQVLVTMPDKQSYVGSQAYWAAAVAAAAKRR